MKEMINSGRRRMLRLLGGAGSAYLVCGVCKPVEAASLSPSPSGQAVNDGVRGAVIRTIVKDLQPEQLGSAPSSSTSISRLIFNARRQAAPMTSTSLSPLPVAPPPAASTASWMAVTRTWGA